MGAGSSPAPPTSGQRPPAPSRSRSRYVRVPEPPPAPGTRSGAAGSTNVCVVMASPPPSTVLKFVGGVPAAAASVALLLLLLLLLLPPASISYCSTAGSAVPFRYGGSVSVTLPSMPTSISGEHVTLPTGAPGAKAAHRPSSSSAVAIEK